MVILDEGNRVYYLKNWGRIGILYENFGFEFYYGLVVESIVWVV